MNGAVEAATEQEALEQLRKRGLGHATLVPTGPTAAPTRPSPKAAQSAPKGVPKPGSNRSVPATAGHGKVISGDPFAPPSATAPPVVIHPPAGTNMAATSGSVSSSASSPSGSAPKQTYATKRGSNRILYFLFSQLANYQTAGVNPVQAYNQLAGQTNQKQYQQSLVMAAQMASSGAPFSSVMEMYPDLYPAGCVGMVRAGEQGGYLYDAYREASRLADQARKMNIWGMVTFVNVILNVMFLWPCWLLSRSFVGMWNSENEHYNSNGFQVLGQVVGHYLLWPFGPLMLASIIVAIYLPKWWLKRSNTYNRHRWALRLWSLKTRAVAEAMQVFTWHLSRTSQAGLSPVRSFELAAGAIPNIVISEAMLKARSTAKEGTTLTSLLSQIPYVSAETLAMAQTGEMTGQVPDMMAQAAQMEAQTFRLQSAASGIKLGCWAMLVIVAAWGIGVIIFALGYVGILKGLMNQ